MYQEKQTQGLKEKTLCWKPYFYATTGIELDSLNIQIQVWNLN